MSDVREMTVRLTDVRALDPGGRALRLSLPAARVHGSLERILNDNVLFALATSSPRGAPHINTAYFAFSDALEIFFLSHPDSRHCRNLARNARAAAAVYSSRQRWDRPDCGLQLFGRCGPAGGRTVALARDVYARRFPHYGEWVRRAPDSAAAYALYRFVPSLVKVFDERELGDGVFVAAEIER